jgi:antagonist of KipI
MSIEVIKPGLLSTLVARGRTGFRYLGVGPGGAMDNFAMTSANYLLGNHGGAATLEMNFPAPELFFHEGHLICVAGKGLRAYINDQVISLWKPFLVQPGSAMKFERAGTGSRAYLSVRSGWKAQAWLGSFTTHLGVKAGGYKGCSLQKGDRLEVNESAYAMAGTKALPWEISKNEFEKIYFPEHEIRITASAETDLLSPESREQLLSPAFRITNQSNRMGYRLEGKNLFLRQPQEMVSSPVDFGTIQLLPDGNLIILMADHQTTGGYPRIASVIKSDLPKLSQLNPNDKINFKLISLLEAEREMQTRTKLMAELKRGCLTQYKNYFKL